MNFRDPSAQKLFFQRIKSSYETAKNFKRSVDFFPKGFFDIERFFRFQHTPSNLQSSNTTTSCRRYNIKNRKQQKNIFNIFKFYIILIIVQYFSWCGLAQSKVRASPSAPAFIKRVNKATSRTTTSIASGSFYDHSTENK